MLLNRGAVHGDWLVVEVPCNAAGGAGRMHRSFPSGCAQGQDDSGNFLDLIRDSLSYFHDNWD